MVSHELQVLQVLHGAATGMGAGIGAPQPQLQADATDLCCAETLASGKATKNSSVATKSDRIEYTSRTWKSDRRRPYRILVGLYYLSNFSSQAMFSPLSQLSFDFLMTARKSNYDRRRASAYRSAKRTSLLGKFERLEDRRMLTVEIEPNNTLATATVFPAGQTLEGRVAAVSDIDYFKVTLAQGAQLSIATDNVLDALFTPTLPPPIDLLDSSGAVLATSADGRSVRFVAPRAGDYFARMVSSSALGTFTANYAMRSVVTNFNGVTEAEPNNTLAQATTATLGATLRGDLASGDAADLFSVSLTVGHTVVVDFTGLVGTVPGVRLLNSSGSVVATELTGLGLSATIPATGTYYLEVGVNSAGINFGQYVAVVNSYAAATQPVDAGNSFDERVSWNFPLLETSQVIGSLNAIDDVDTYQFEVTSNYRLNFSLQPGGGDTISGQNKLLALSNQYGQLLSYSTTGSMTQERTDAIAPGKYFLTVSATTGMGLGAYALQVNTQGFFADQRDVPVHFIDFNKQQATYLGYSWANSYAATNGIPFVVGMFDARYDVFDVDVTLQLPSDGAERISSGYGDFGNIDGAGGWGGGWYGQRRSSGNTVSSTTETWSTLDYSYTTVLNHEFGHATGIPHARLATALMGYVNTTQLLPVGDGYAFVGTDSRRPGTAIVNERNYLDWSLQAGSQVFSQEPNNSPSTAQPLGANLLEMSADLLAQPSVASGQRPNHIVAGDFNNDGRRDVVVASVDSNDVRVYLGNGTGGLTLRSTTVVDDLNWWEESLAVGDFNGDSRSDVAVISRSNSRIGIMLAAADGSLPTPTWLTSTADLHSITTGDMNRDNRLDLVVGGGNRVTTHLGNGDGTFGAARTVAAPFIPHSLALADFSGDGFLDIATANNGNGSTVLMNDGTGQFTTSIALAGATNARAVTAGDFNRDGRQDIALANRDTHDIWIYTNLGSNSFSVPAKIAGHRDAETLVTGDVNRDGVIDLVSGGFNVSFVAMLGNGDGTFGRPIVLEGGDSEASAALVDLTGDGFNDIVSANYFSNTITAFISQADNPRNNRVTVMGAIDSRDDVDLVALPVRAGETWTIDIDAAEFQYPLDATVRILSTAGAVLTTGLGGLDRDSGLDSVDPYVTWTFASAETVLIEVSGVRSSVGNYRLKLTPATAYEVDAPRVIASIPDNGATLDATNQITFFIDDQIDPASITSNSIVVTGQATGVRPGTARFNVLDQTITWTSAVVLAPDTYTVRLSSGVNGLKDLRGNPLDGETAANFRFPAVSGNGIPGGDFTMQFVVNATDTNVASVNRVDYDRDPYQRGQFRVYFNDTLSVASVESATFTLRGAGPDRSFGTADDRLMPLDVVYDKIYHNIGWFIDLYTRGVPDPDQYRIEAALVDSAGNAVALSYVTSIGTTVPETALFVDAALTQPGLTGSYINSSLRSQTAQADWRATQVVAGTRTDLSVAFNSDGWGTRSTVGLTGGTDANWDNFSTQWDGWIRIGTDGTRLQTKSDDGSRMWIDVNGDGTFAATNDEFFNNNFGVGQGLTAGALSTPLNRGNYRIRIQYEEGSGGNQMMLEWLTPDTPGSTFGYAHGPAVIGLNIPSGTVVQSPNMDRIEVTFSAALDTASLRPQNFVVRYSSDASFFDGNDTFITDTDGVIAWDATLHRATFQAFRNFAVGYYLVELNGDVGGIRAPDGRLLDGEFLNTRIIGNTTSANWNESPSGDGIAGGDYRSMFVVGASALSLEIVPGSMSESGGAALGTITRLNAPDLTQPLVVTLQSSDTTEATVPASVTISAGQTSVSFPITAVDDTTIDGTQSVTISAAATNFIGTTADVQVVDHEPLQLSLDSSSMSEKGGVLRGTITRTNAIGTLSVAVNNSLAGRANTVTSVSFADGQLISLPFAITAVDNTILDGNQSGTITVSSAGMIDAQASYTVLDFEPLSISIQPLAISERGGQATMVVTRTDTTNALTVNLSTNSPDEISLPASVTIPAGSASSAPITITGVIDNLVDGTQTASVRAAAVGYIEAIDTIQVLDSEQLVLSLTTSSVSEKDGVTELRIQRVDTRGTLLVNLNVDVAGQVSMPATVTLLDGESQSNIVTVRGLDNNLLDGPRAVRITANAVGYIDGATTLIVTDYEPLSLSLTGPASISERNGTSKLLITRTDGSRTVDVAIESGDSTEATGPTLVTMAAGVTSQEFTVSAVDDDLLDGLQNVSFSVAALGYIGGSATLSVEDFELLELSLTQTSIAESNKTVTGTVRRRNLDINQPLTVQLSSADTSEVTVPAQVTIPAGLSTASFAVTSVDDQLLDGTITVAITAAATGYVAGSTSIDVTDVEFLSLEATELLISENAGTAHVTVIRSNTNTGSDLTVTLTNSLPSRLTVPDTITIPAGERNTTFVVSAVDDLLLAPADIVQIEATAETYTAAVLQLTITDYETLGVTFENAVVAENGGTITGRVTRSNTNTDQSVNVALTLSDTSEAIVPLNVTIPAGQSSVAFVLTGLDDTLLDGSQSVVVSAKSGEYVTGQATVTIEDHEQLTIAFDAASLAENAAILGATLTRSNTDQSEDLTVLLQANLPGVLSLPASLTIPSGQASVRFAVTSIDNDLLTGDRTIQVSALADGYVAPATSLDILDVEALSLTVDRASISERDGVATGKVRRSNSNIESAITVVLTNNKPGEVTLPASVTIAAGVSEVSFAVTAIDENVLDGSQLVTLTGSSESYQDGLTLITITDYETLTVSIPSGTLAEKNGAVTASVRRNNENLSSAVVVALASSDNTQLSIPASVTIPANATLTTFTILSLDDAIVDGDRTFVITATATGYIDGTGSVQVVDDENSFPWNNPRNSLDVNNDGFVTAIDALLIINELNSGRGGKLNPPPPGNNVFFDTSADNFVTAIDALLVINHLNTRPNGEGEELTIFWEDLRLQGRKWIRASTR